MGNYYCKLYLFGEEVNKVLKLFEYVVIEGRNLLVFFFLNNFGFCRLTRIVCEVFYFYGSQTVGVFEYFDVYFFESGVESKLVEFIGNRFNIIFYNFVVVFYYKSYIQDFFFKWFLLNRLFQFVVKDIVEFVYLVGVRVFGILDKIVIGFFFRLIEKVKFVFEFNFYLKRM